MGIFSEIGDFFEGAIDSAQALVTLPATLTNLLVPGVIIAGLCLLAVVFTMCWSVGSGKTNVNELANTAVRYVKV